METLTQLKCVACRKDAPTTTDAEIAEFHPQVSDWEIVELDGIKRLRRVFSFDDFAQALEFTMTRTPSRSTLQAAVFCSR